MAIDLNDIRKMREAQKGRRDIARQTMDLTYRIAVAGDTRTVAGSIGAWLANDEPEYVALFDPEMWSTDSLEGLISAAEDVATFHGIVIAGTLTESKTESDEPLIGFSLLKGPRVEAEGGEA